MTSVKAAYLTLDGSTRSPESTLPDGNGNVPFILATYTVYVDVTFENSSSEKAQQIS